MNEPPRVLIIEDQIGDLTWLLDLIRSRGYEVVVATNGEAGKKRLEAVQRGDESYELAIVDVMVATKALKDILETELDEKFFEDSRNTGIRLCRYAREELHLSSEDLFIVCLTVRDDEDVRSEMHRLGIPLYNKVSQNPKESIREFLKTRLSIVPREGAP